MCNTRGTVQAMENEWNVQGDTDTHKEIHTKT